MASSFGLLFLVLLLSPLEPWQCAARNVQPSSASSGESLRILSPFFNEPIGAEEMEVSVDVSSLPVSCGLSIVINGHSKANYMLDRADHSKTVWTWRPDPKTLQGLDGFMSLHVVARLGKCDPNAHAEHKCRTEDSEVIARADVDFEIVRFTKLQYSGACPATKGKNDVTAAGANVTRGELREVLRGNRPATTGMLKMLAPMVARRLGVHQNRGRHCPIARFVLWNSFGVHGFGSQLQSLRIGLEYGLRTNRIVVQNPQFEAYVVREDLKLRFAEHSPGASASGSGSEIGGGGWGAGGLYWDNLESEQGEMYKLSECDDHVTRWLSRATYSPLTQWADAVGVCAYI